ncbi:MAG: hypothetical protein N3I86_00540 [Verrucomicrobiae bacterium]|nr:hypothetical protein [Verrucomicrobiae bacterium]
MVLKKLFSRAAPPPLRMPSGCFTVDRDGAIVVSTLPSDFPEAFVREIGRHVRETFAEARAAQLPLHELIVHYGGLKIVARELRGGALVFLSPVTLISPARSAGDRIP